MALINMKQDKEEAREGTCAADPTDAPRYPWGLELSLNEKDMAKLGVTSPPAPGTEMMITAKVMVTSASQRQTQGEQVEMSSCWQITDMEVSTSARTDHAQALYGQ